METPSKTPSILLGAVVTGILGVIFSIASQQYQWLGIISCCLVPITGGILAVWHYTTTYELTIPGGEGARIGALTAFLGNILASILAVILSFVGIGHNPFSSEAAREAALQQLERQNLPPEAYDQALQQIERFTSPEFIFLFALVGLIVYVLIGAVGGAIGSALFKQGDEATPSEE